MSDAAAEVVRVHVRFFATLREQLGCAGVEVALGTDKTLEGLVAHLLQRFGDAAQALVEDNVNVAVNQELCEGSCTLCEGDEVGFLPPVTGG